MRDRRGTWRAVMTGDGLRALLGDGAVTHLPGVYDAVTASLAVRAGHRAVYLPWAAVSAITLGRPDQGYVPAAQIADRAATITPSLRGLPLLADADIGDGEPSQAVWTAMAYQRVGISGVLLTDALRGRAGDAGTGVAEAPRAAASVAAVVTQVPGVALIARTGVYASRGPAGAIERCRLYADAGAHAVCVSGVDDPGELGRIRDAVPGVPLVVDLAEATASRPSQPDAVLAGAGVRLVLHPTTALLAAARAASLAYRALADGGDPGPVDRLPWAAFTDLGEPGTAERGTPAGVGRAARGVSGPGVRGVPAGGGVPGHTARAGVGAGGNPGRAYEDPAARLHT